MFGLFFYLYLQAAILISGDITTPEQTGATQTTIGQPTSPINSSVKPAITTTTIGGGGWDDKN